MFVSSRSIIYLQNLSLLSISFSVNSWNIDGVLPRVVYPIITPANILLTLAVQQELRTRFARSVLNKFKISYA